MNRQQRLALCAPIVVAGLIVTGCSSEDTQESTTSTTAITTVLSSASSSASSASSASEAISTVPAEPAAPVAEQSAAEEAADPASTWTLPAAADADPEAFRDSWGSNGFEFTAPGAYPTYCSLGVEPLSGASYARCALSDGRAVVLSDGIAAQVMTPNGVINAAADGSTPQTLDGRLYSGNLQCSGLGDNGIECTQMDGGHGFRLNGAEPETW